jgi:hypothetical protein
MPGQSIYQATTFSLHPHQLAWLDARRRRGSLTRSAALRQLLDHFIATEPLVSPSQPQPLDA